ncbi:MAG: hypothetical protein VW879_02490 [Opitutae bacterium]
MTNIKQFPGKKSGEELPEEASNTEAYLLNEVLYCVTPTKTVPDLETGNQRNRRWGASVALAVIPEFSQVPPNEAPTLLPKSPSRFFAADSLEELKARIIYELEKAIEMARMSVESPEEFMKLQQELMLKEQAAMQQLHDQTSDSKTSGFSTRDPDDDMN